MPNTTTFLIQLGLLSAGLALGVWRGAAAISVARDARRRGWSQLASIGWATMALVYAPRYWWEARLAKLAPPEAVLILESAARAHRLASVANVRCPLCDTEIVNALTIKDAGRLELRIGAICERCDFRLDACRHCQHFLPAEDGIGGQKDFTYGRCARYRASQPVREAYPHIAARLESQGYDTLNAPKRIADSFVPLDECQSFALAPERLQISRIAWLTRQRLTLIALDQKRAR